MFFFLSRLFFFFQGDILVKREKKKRKVDLLSTTNREKARYNLVYDISLAGVLYLATMFGRIPLSKRSEKRRSVSRSLTQMRNIIVSLYTPRYENPSIRSLFINATNVLDARNSLETICGPIDRASQLISPTQRCIQDDDDTSSYQDTYAYSISIRARKFQREERKKASVPPFANRSMVAGRSIFGQRSIDRSSIRDPPVASVRNEKEGKSSLT